MGLRGKNGFSPHIISQTSSLPFFFFSNFILSHSHPAWISILAQKSLNNYANACKAMHNTVWKWLGEKMDSLRTDGMSAKSHLLWMQEEISDNVRTWETSDMFFHTKHYLLWWCSSWLFQRVDDYKWATCSRRWGRDFSLCMMTVAYTQICIQLTSDHLFV